MPKRSVERAYIIRATFLNQLDPYMVSLARHTGIFFVLIGGFFSLLLLETLGPGTSTPQLAALLNTDHEQPAATESVAPEATQPKVEFIEVDGQVLRGVATLTVRLYGGREPRLTARNRASGAEVVLLLSRTTEDTVKFSWDTTAVPDEGYSLHLHAVSDGVVYEFDGPMVVVDNVPDIVAASDDTATSATSVVEAEVAAPVTASATEKPAVRFTTKDGAVARGPFTSSLQVEGVEEAALALRAAAGTDRYPLVQEASNPSEGVWAFTIDSTTIPDGPYRLVAKLYRSGYWFNYDGPLVSVENDTLLGATSTASSTLAAPALVVDTPDDVLTGPVRLRLAADDVAFVELYALPAGSVAPRFVGLMRQGTTPVWYYTLDTSSLPNGDYRFRAVVKRAGVLTPVDTRTYTVANAALTTTLPGTASTTPPLETLDEVIADARTDASLLDASEAEATDVVAVLTAELIASYQNELEALLTRLGSAYRSGDEALIAAARERLTELRATMVSTALERGSADRITLVEESLEAQFGTLIERSVATEQLIRERTTVEIANDTDGDGVVDYDERVLYGTDPTRIDTDGDGFHDGVELLGGYNPLDPTPEAVVRFESPREAGVVSGDVLVVEAVRPVVGESVADAAPPVVEITGRALPNSFVTLFIYSTPTIVTVKTEADGAFTYRFEKELEDGVHEVYVGVTDNAGRVIAKSAPFQFIKEAEAFTPVDTVAPAVLSSGPAPLTSGANVSLVVSVAVVAIGLVLMLLGWKLEATRPRRSEDSLSV